MKTKLDKAIDNAVSELGCSPYLRDLIHEVRALQARVRELTEQLDCANALVANGVEIESELSTVIKRLTIENKMLDEWYEDVMSRSRAGDFFNGYGGTIKLRGLAIRPTESGKGE